MNSTKLLASTLFTIVTAANSAQIYDDFSNPKWISFSSPNVSVYEKSNKLVIATNANASGYVFSGGYASSCKLQGDFDIRADYTILSTVVNNGVRVGILVDIEPTNGSRLNKSWAAINRFSDTNGTSVYSTNFSNYDPVTSDIPTSDIKGKLRLSRTGTVLSGYFWDSTTKSWILIQSTSKFTANPVYFILSSWSHDGYFAKVLVKSTFDNVIITSGTCE
jgi:hypothetical protein